MASVRVHGSCVGYGVTCNVKCSFSCSKYPDVGPNVLCVVLCCAVLSKNYCSVDRDRSRREQEVAQYILP